ncbi:MAG: threonine ammonia-lyase [Thermoprotei archaeon]
MTNGELEPPSIDDVKTAFSRISTYVYKTPLDKSRSLSSLSGADVYTKDENLQRTGSFKVRGALNKIRSSDPSLLARGVVTASAGNHAQGVAYACSAVGAHSKIFMPEGTPLIKVEATRAYGGSVVLQGRGFEEAYEAAKLYQAQTGAMFVHPFEDRQVMAGQGTIGLELAADLDEFDAVVVPIGGGGLIVGLGRALKALRPSVRVYGVQSKGADAMARSIKTGVLVKLDDTRTFAEGIAVKSPSKRMLELVSQVVDDVAVVDDDDISYAILTLMERSKLVVEGAGAASVAAVLSSDLNLKGKRVVCLLSGGNIDMLTLDRVLAKGLAKAGRRCAFEITLRDRPGELSRVLEIIAAGGGNVATIDHDRSDRQVPVGYAKVSVAVETNGFSHQEALRQALVRNGFNVEK